MTTKSEFYTKAINIYKETGQGLSGIVFVMDTEASLFREYMNEFIEEGLMICCEDGTTIGHTEAARWYMPTSGYNVWLDDNSNERLKGKNLHFLRYYLGVIELNNEPALEREKIQKWLNPSAQYLTQSPDFISAYSEWLSKNHEALEEMKNLSNIYMESSLEIDENGKDSIKSLKDYDENPTVSEMINILQNEIELDQKIKNTTIDMVSLMKKAKYSKEKIEKSESDVEKYNKEIETLQRAIRYLQKQNQEDKIQNIIS